MDNSEIFNLLKENNLISYTQHFDKYIVKRISKCIDFLKHIVTQLPQNYDSYDEFLYCIINNDCPENHICQFCNEKEVFVSATRGYKTCGNKACKSKKIKQTTFARYGVNNAAQSEFVKNKIKKTNIARYGCEYGLSNADVIEKRKKTCIDKYGVDNVWKSEDVKKKIYDTNLERYGFSTASKNNNIKDKMKTTCVERYGVNSPLQNEEIKNKSKNTFRSKYGVDSYTQTKEYRNKIKAYWANITQEKIEEWKNKQKQTTLEKYGVEYFVQTSEYHKIHRSEYLYDGIYFDSSWEVYFYIYCKENNIDVVKNPCRFKYLYNGDIHYYIPDFSADGQLIEIKGDHFFDKDGNLINPFDRLQDAAYKAKQECMLTNNVKILKYSDMKSIIESVDAKYTSDFVHLFKVGLAFPYLNSELKDKSDLGLIHYFHKSIYEANVDKKLSPIEAWNDKALINKVALNRLKYVGQCRPSDILQGFSVTKCAPKVSVFNPSLAKRLIEKYLNDYKEVFDPFSGFSGRMLGAAALNKTYIGQDINKKHIQESNEIIKYKNLFDLVALKQQDVLTDTQNTHDCLFTCPPYGNKEHWNDDEIIKSCDDWIKVCLNTYKCKKYLFVVDDTIEFKDYIVEELKTKSHFSTVKEYAVLI